MPATVQRRRAVRHERIRCFHAMTAEPETPVADSGELPVDAFWKASLGVCAVPPGGARIPGFAVPPPDGSFFSWPVAVKEYEGRDDFQALLRTSPPDAGTISKVRPCCGSSRERSTAFVTEPPDGNSCRWGRWLSGA